MASGNQTCSGNCADLPTQPRKIPSPAATQSQCIESLRRGEVGSDSRWKISWKLNVPT